MHPITELSLCTILPMAAVQSGYLLADRKFSLTRRLTVRFSFLKNRKMLFQIVFPLFFILLFGAVCLICSIPPKVYYAFCGVYIGITNGIARGVMRDQ